MENYNITDMIDMIGVIGKKVTKKSGKPFKSGNKVNTVKNIVPHEHLNERAFTFEEDDSYVSISMCEIEK